MTKRKYHDLKFDELDNEELSDYEEEATPQDQASALTEEETLYYNALINSVDDSVIPPMEPWGQDRFHNTFAGIYEMLTTNHLNEEFQQQVWGIINLSDTIKHPENISPEALGFYTANLMRLLLTSTDPISETEIVVVLNSLNLMLSTAALAEREPVPNLTINFAIDPITAGEFQNIFTRINDLLSRSHLNEESQQRISKIISLSEYIENPENLSPGTLSFYTSYLIWLEGLENPHPDEVRVVLDTLYSMLEAEMDYEITNAAITAQDQASHDITVMFFYQPQENNTVYNSLYEKQQKYEFSSSFVDLSGFDFSPSSFKENANILDDSNKIILSYLSSLSDYSIYM